MKQIPLPATYKAEYRKLFENDFPEETAEGRWKAVASLWRREWWHRSWIVQEIALAPEALIFCGNHHVTWMQLCETVHVFRQHISFLWFVEHPFKKRALELMDFLIIDHWPFRILANLVVETRGQSTSGIPPELIVAMGSIRGTRCKDPRDKLYAAIGISNDRIPVKVDYSLSVEEVYASVARLFIETYQNLSLLSYCSLDSKSFTIPSWVPDWRIPVSKTIISLPQVGARGLGQGLQKVPVYEISSVFRLNFRIEACGRTLVIKAVPFDEVAFVSSKADSETRDNRELVEDVGWLREWGERRSKDTSILRWITTDDWQYSATKSIEQFNHLEYNLTGQRLLEAYIRTLCANVILDDESDLETHLPKELDDITKKDTYLARVGGRRLAVSYNGILILAPAATERGDILTIVPGSEIPLVLRKARDSFILVGQCYAHGCMGSELWDTLGYKYAAYHSVEMCII